MGRVTGRGLSGSLTSRIRRQLTLAIRQPRYYALLVAGVAAAVLPSFNFMDPVRLHVEKAPVFGEPSVLYYIGVFLVAWLVLYLVGFGFRILVRPHPLNNLAEMLGKTEFLPSIDDQIRSELLEPGARQPLEDERYSLVSVQSETLELFSQLNYEAFRRTAFGMRLSEIRKRNRDIHRKFPESMQLVVLDAGGLHIPIGISYVIPLSYLGQMEYAIQGKVADSDLKPRHVARSLDEAQALLLFAMGLAPVFRSYVPMGRALLPPVFLRHIALLLQGTSREHGGMLLYAQTEAQSGGIGRFLKRIGFEDTGTVTGDGEPLIMADVSLLPKPSNELKPFGLRDLRSRGRTGTQAEDAISNAPDNQDERTDDD